MKSVLLWKWRFKRDKTFSIGCESEIIFKPYLFWKIYINYFLLFFLGGGCYFQSMFQPCYTQINYITPKLMRRINSHQGPFPLFRATLYCFEPVIIFSMAVLFHCIFSVKITKKYMHGIKEKEIEFQTYRKQLNIKGLNNPTQCIKTRNDMWLFNRRKWRIGSYNRITCMSLILIVKWT